MDDLNEGCISTDLIAAGETLIIEEGNVVVKHFFVGVFVHWGVAGKKDRVCYPTSALRR